MSLRAKRSGAKQSHALQAVMRLLCRSFLTPRNDKYLLHFNPDESESLSTLIILLRQIYQHMRLFHFHSRPEILV